MAVTESDQLGARLQGEQDAEYFLDRAATPEFTVHRVEDILQPIPLDFEEPTRETYTSDGRPLLARMVVEDTRGRRADIRVIATGQNGEPEGYVFDASLRGMPGKDVTLLLTDPTGFQLESVEPPHLDQLRVRNGSKQFDVSMRQIQWEIPGRSRDGQQSAALFMGSHQRFQGGNIAIMRPS